MGLKALATELKDERTRYNDRCSVTSAYLLLQEHDPESAKDFIELLDGTESGPFIADVVTRRFKQLGVDFTLKGGPVNNHRRKGCTCGTL